MIDRINPLSPPAIRRVSEAVAASVLQPQYGTPLGLLFLAGDLDKRQYRASMAFREAWEAREATLGASSPQSPQYGEHASSRARREVYNGDGEEFASMELAARGVGVEPYHWFWKTVIFEIKPGAWLWCVRKCAEALADRQALGSRHRRARRA